MGQQQHTSSAKSSQKASRFPPRPCLRKGCERTFVPGHWNQRYCREPECLRELHRWQAAKRQRRRRSHPENRRQHAEAERCRRRCQREQRRVALAKSSPPSRTPDQDQESAPRAWSRGANIFEDFCDRPGCYEPLRCSCRAPARYCGDSCRQAMDRVRSRERKYKRRKGMTAAAWLADENGRAGQDRRQTAGGTAAGEPRSTSPGRRRAVRSYGPSPEARIAFHETHPETSPDDRETSVGRRPRAPPSA